MAEFIRCCLLLLLMTRLSSGVTGTISKYGCNGDYIELYKNISFNTPDIVVSLFKNGEHNVMIAMWTMVKSVFTETFSNGYGEKMFLDKQGNILIRSLNVHDEGKYVLQIIHGSWTAKYEVQLFVLVAPATHCRARIIRSENTLIASLTMADCGKPAVSVYWLEHSGISYGRNIVKLPSGSKGGTYHACIEGPAMTCAKSTKLSDFCEVFRVDEAEIGSSVTVSGVSHMADTPAVINSTMSGLSEMPVATLAMIILISILIVISVVAFIILFLRMIKMQKRITKSCRQDERKSQKRMMSASNVEGDEISMLVQESNDPVPSNAKPDEIKSQQQRMSASNVEGDEILMLVQESNDPVPSNAEPDEIKSQQQRMSASNVEDKEESPHGTHIKTGTISLPASENKSCPGDIRKVKSMNDCNDA